MSVLKESAEAKEKLIALINNARKYSTYSDHLTTHCLASHDDKYRRCLLEYQRLEHMLGCDIDLAYKSFRHLVNREFGSKEEEIALENINAIIDIRNYYVHYALLDLESNSITRELFNEGLIALYFYIFETEDYFLNHINKNNKIFTEINKIKSTNN